MVKDETQAADEMVGNLTEEQFAKIESSWNEFLKKRARNQKRFYAIWTIVFSALLALALFYVVFTTLCAVGAI